MKERMPSGNGCCGDRKNRSADTLKPQPYMTVPVATESTPLPSVRDRADSLPRQNITTYRK